LKRDHFTFTPFKGLRDSLGEKRNPAETRTEEEVFLDAMSDVREIREFREIPYRKPGNRPRKGILAKKRDDTVEILRAIVRGEKKIRLSDTGEYIEWRSPEFNRNITRRLHEGDYSVQDCIDLHGMTTSEAEEALFRFFREAIRRGHFCVKVIHGRGLRSHRGPVLKKAMEKWLHGSFRKLVGAYVTAKDCDGGLGATYIILKQR